MFRISFFWFILCSGFLFFGSSYVQDFFFFFFQIHDTMIFISPRNCCGKKNEKKKQFMFISQMVKIYTQAPFIQVFEV